MTAIDQLVCQNTGCVQSVQLLLKETNLIKKFLPVSEINFKNRFLNL